MSIDRKVQEARSMGVPEREIQRVLQNNAMKARDGNTRAQLMNAGGAVYKQIGGQLRNNAAAARDAKVGGSLIQGGLKGIGTAQSNLAQGIGQAGLNNRSFSPTQSALSPIGDAAAARGQAEAQYQKDLSGIAQGEQARADAQAAKAEEKAEQDKKDAAKKDEQAQLYRRYSSSAQKALAYVDPASPALDALSKAEAAANAAYATAAVIPIVNQGTAALGQVRENSIHKWMRNWAQKSKRNQASYEAFKLLEGSVTELTTTALKAQGPGPKTDFDFVVAARSTADLSATPGAIKKSLQRLITNAGEELTALGVDIPTAATDNIILPDAPKTYDSPKIDGPQQQYGVDNKDILGAVGINKAKGVADAVADKVETVKDKVKSITGVKGSGTQEDPYKVPIGRITKKSVINWLEDKDLPDGSYVTWKKISGTVEQLVEYLTEE